MLQKQGLGELVEMDVGDLNDAKAVEFIGQVRNTDRRLDLFDEMAGDLPGIKCQAGRRNARSEDEGAAGESKW